MALSRSQVGPGGQPGPFSDVHEASAGRVAHVPGVSPGTAAVRGRDGRLSVPPDGGLYVRDPAAARADAIREKVALYKQLKQPVPPHLQALFDALPPDTGDSDVELVSGTGEVVAEVETVTEPEPELEPEPEPEPEPAVDITAYDTDRDPEGLEPEVAAEPEPQPEAQPEPEPEPEPKAPAKRGPGRPRKTT